MTNKIDWTQPIELMDGTLCKCEGSLRVVVDEYGRIGGVQVVRNRAMKVVFVNIYEGAPEVAGHASRKEADTAARSSRIACVRVEYFIGEGLGTRESTDD